MIRRQYGKNFDEVCNRAVEFSNRHVGGIEAAERFINRAGWGHSHFGIEYVSTCDRELAYLNTGDTYNLTVCQEGHGEVFSSSWGDWLEEAENEHCEDEGEIKCCNCGEFTPVDPECWHYTVCEHCGRLVDCGEFPPVYEDEEFDDDGELLDDDDEEWIDI
jgi:hypothetical protein